MAKEYYINTKTYASCTNGVLPGMITTVFKDRSVSNKGYKMANIDDRFTPFSCKYAILIAVLAAVFIAALSFVAAFLIGLIIGLGICFIATYTQKWKNFHPRVFVQGKNALTDKSFIECPIGGVITPTFSPLVASLRAGVNFATTLLEAALIYIGGKGAVQIFKNYGAKIAIDYTAANYLLNLATDKAVTQPLSRLITGDPKTESDIPATIKEQVGYFGDGTPYPVKNQNGEYVSRNADDYDNFRNINSSTSQQQTANADAAANQAHSTTTGQQEGNRAYTQEMQRQGAQINADERIARQNYRDLYKRMAKMEGESGRAADKQARSQAVKSARRDAAMRRAQARQDAAIKREQAIAQAKQSAANQARNDVMNDRAARNNIRNQLRWKAAQGFFKSWAVGVAIGVANNVFTSKANKAIDNNAEQWQNEVIKKLGLNAVAVSK